MKKQIIATATAPKAVGPYSQAVLVGDTLYCSGQIPLDPVTGTLYGNTIDTQAERVMENIRAVLKEADMDFSNVVKATCLLEDMEHFAEFNKVYARYFEGNYPARSTFAVRALPKGALVEVEVIAVK